MCNRCPVLHELWVCPLPLISSPYACGCGTSRVRRTALQGRVKCRRVPRLHRTPLLATTLEPRSCPRDLTSRQQWSSFGDLQEISFQHPMKCKDKNLIWEDGVLHWRNSTFGHDDRYSPWVGWVILTRKILESHLHIYDIG